MATFYELINGWRTMLSAELHAAYKNALIAHHPDRFVGDTPEDIAHHEERYKQITEAWSFLQTVRTAYNNFYATHGDPCGKCRTRGCVKVKADLLGQTQQKVMCQTCKGTGYTTKRGVVISPEQIMRLDKRRKDAK